MDKGSVIGKNPKVRWTITELRSSIAEANPYFKNATPQILTGSAMSSTSIETGITISYDYNRVLANALPAAKVTTQGKAIKYKTK